MSNSSTPQIYTSIWEEVAEKGNPFAASICYCRGYDVYGDLVGHARYIDYLYLLFKGERPAPHVASALESIAIALANPGPRDPSVHAAMAAGVGGSTAASALIAALSVGAGSYQGGGREIFLALNTWGLLGTDLNKWKAYLQPPFTPPHTSEEVWPSLQHPPGFEPYSSAPCSQPVQQMLTHLLPLLPGRYVSWLGQHQEELEIAAGRGLSLSGVIAASLADLGFSSNEGEMLTLLLRLPGAAVHALEQQQQGFRKFPFFSLELENDPGLHAQGATA